MDKCEIIQGSVLFGLYDEFDVHTSNTKQVIALG